MLKLVFGIPLVIIIHCFVLFGVITIETFSRLFRNIGAIFVV